MVARDPVERRVGRLTGNPRPALEESLLTRAARFGNIPRTENGIHYRIASRVKVPPLAVDIREKQETHVLYFSAFYIVDKLPILVV